MQFGIFSQMHRPPWDDEHDRFMRELEVAEAARIKYEWASEHRTARQRRVRAETRAACGA